MPDLRGLVTDPDFNALPAEQKRSLLQKIGADPRFIDELLGGPAAPKAPPEPKGFLDTLQEGARRVAQTPIPNAMVDIIPGGSIYTGPHVPFMGSTSVEEMLENLPVIGGLTGAVLGGPVGATGLAAGGEAWRQNARRALGLPASTGLVQRLMDLDPDSPEAALSGLGAETAAGPAAEGVSRVLGAASKLVDKSALRSLTHLLDPRTPVDKDDALKLAAKLREAGIAPPLSSRTSQVARAEKALAEATTKLDAAKAPLIAAGADLPTQGIHDKVLGAIPETLPSGNVPLRGTAERTAAEQVAYDVLDSTGGGDRMPLSTALSQKERIDRQIRRYYKSGPLNVPVGVEFDKNAADAFRGAIHNKFPKLGADLTSKSELISITQQLKDALKKTDQAGTSASEAGASLGGAATGRWSIPFINTFKKIVHSGPIASLSASGKTLLGNILDGGASTTQAWMRIADEFNVGASEGPEAERPEDLNLKELAKSILEHRAKPTEPTISEEEFIRRYQ